MFVIIVVYAYKILLCIDNTISMEHNNYDTFFFSSVRECVTT